MTISGKAVKVYIHVLSSIMLSGREYYACHYCSSKNVVRLLLNCVVSDYSPGRTKLLHLLIKHFVYNQSVFCWESCFRSENGMADILNDLVIALPQTGMGS